MEFASSALILQELECLLMLDQVSSGGGEDETFRSPIRLLLSGSSLNIEAFMLMFLFSAPCVVERAYAPAADPHFGGGGTSPPR